MGREGGKGIKERWPRNYKNISDFLYFQGAKIKLIVMTTTIEWIYYVGIWKMFNLTIKIRFVIRNLYVFLM